jgi:alanyl-tRNA synthetase
MTERLYYTDPYLRTFDATIRRVESHGGRTAVVLDRTAFYPTSGGQPFDVGMLGSWRVVDVRDEDDGSIAHVIDIEDGGVAPVAGAVVQGAIDWKRRFDHMQQHTGQHVLSAGFARMLEIRTVSFHLGAEVSTIDLAREATAAEIARVEEEANRVVWDDRAIAIRFASSEEAAQLPLRKEPVRGGTLRLIDIENWDLSACGGTHVARTGAIGVIAVAGWERFKGGQRLEFLCGTRALRRFRSMRDTIATSVRLLSVQPDELPGSIERLQAEVKEQNRAATALQTDLARYRAAELAAAAEPAARARVVVRTIDADANGLKALAVAAASTPGLAVGLVSASQPALVVVARSADVSTISAQQVVSALLAQFGGRGGGRPELAQGGGLTGPADAILARIRELLTETAGA